MLLCVNAPAHRNVDCPRGRIEIKMLPPYLPFLNIAEQAISALKAAIKADISRPDIQATIDDQDEAQRQGIPLGEYQQRILLEASQRNMNTITAAKCVGWFRFMKTYIPRCLNRENIEGYCLHLSVMTFKYVNDSVIDVNAFPNT